MKMIQHLPNGSAIKFDVIESFKKAIENAENIVDGALDWDFVSADMHLELLSYNWEYIEECLETLIEALDS